MVMKTSNSNSSANLMSYLKDMEEENKL